VYYIILNAIAICIFPGRVECLIILLLLLLLCNRPYTTHIYAPPWDGVTTEHSKSEDHCLLLFTISTTLTRAVCRNRVFRRRHTIKNDNSNKFRVIIGRSCFLTIQTVSIDGRQCALGKPFRWAHCVDEPLSHIIIIIIINDRVKNTRATFFFYFYYYYYYSYFLRRTPSTQYNNNNIIYNNFIGGVHGALLSGNFVSFCSRAGLSPINNNSGVIIVKNRKSCDRQRRRRRLLLTIIVIIIIVVYTVVYVRTFAQ